MGYSVAMKSPAPAVLALALALALSPQALCAQAALPDISVESVELGGNAELVVESDRKATAVYLDYFRRGSAPLTLESLSPGPHLLVLRSEGYYDLSLQLNLAPNTRTTITAYLELITGYLSVEAEPSWAELIIDGDSYGQGILLLPAGLRSVRVQAFGYKSQDFSVFIPEKLMATLRASLERAPFEVESYALSAERFNPRNSGLKGSVRLGFRVSAPGRAEAKIFAADGQALREWKLGPFSDWEQALSWDGRDAAGHILPDGEYRLVLQARPEPGTDTLQDVYDYERALRIDSTLVVTPSGRYGALPGSVLSPDAFTVPDSSLSVSIGAVFSGQGAEESYAGVRGGVELSLGLSLEGSVDLGLGARASAGDEAGVALAGLRYAFALPRPLGAALALDGGLSASSGASPSWLRLAAPLGLGGRFLNLSLAPELGLYWADGNYARAGLSAALTVSGYALGASLSARAQSRNLDEGLAASWPLELAAELRILPAGLPLSFTLFGLVSLNPEPNSWKAGLALSGGF
jgi:hypothetical protein